MSFKKIFIYGLWHKIVGTRIASRYFGYFANARLYPPFLRLLIRVYISVFGINMKEYDFNLSKVRTFNEFFTRKLKKGARTWAEGICSPVDGYMLSHGAIEKEQLFQVKGMNYSLAQLTASDTIQEGSFINLYLSPADYHRVHAPFDMEIKRLRHIPGKLLSVSEKNARTVKDLYNKNERLILSGDSKFGPFHFVFVGALNVGSIRLSFMPAFRTNLKVPEQKHQVLEQKLARGEELGFFEMGSTVIIISATKIFRDLVLGKGDKRVQLGMQLVDPA